jgi:release factor glutamine methyltransferase
MITIGEAIAAARRRFAPVSDSAGLDAQILLGEILGADRAYLIAHAEQVLTDEQAERFAALVNRHAAGEPVAYILEQRAFYDRDFIVTPDVLIPRPETELLLERALAYLAAHPAAVVADIGTGSGALAVTVAANAPKAQVYAVDISPAALAVARRNAEIHAVAERITFLEGDLLTPIIDRGIQLDLVLANLPYIASGEVPTLAVSQYEPLLALDGGADGLDLVRRLLARLPAACHPGALALLEIGADQGAAMLALAGSGASVHQDYAGLDRIVELKTADQ